MSALRALLVVSVVAACGGSKHHPAPDQEDPPLPGIAAPSPALEARLRLATVAKGPAYRPRTRHLLADGSPRFTNRLILENSPYLLQHAHNPVNWFPWGDAAFERARAEGKAVMLSIGYSTCHWCHVMERESFEDEELATFLNQHFVAIKVDREERPDLDDVYMKAVQELTGRGGWPMTVFLMPDRRPFYGGTYFPRAQFLAVLEQVAAAVRANPADAASDATRLVAAIQPAEAQLGDLPGPEAIEVAARTLARSFDASWGGFGGAPKFPRPVALELLLRYYRRTADASALAMVTLTLERMAAGGVYDHLGGGFHRYATDAQWLVPHFEKMLYDQAQLAMVYLDAHQVTGREAFAVVVRETLDYLVRDLASPDGGFYSATDADSPTPGGGEAEGAYFTWTPGELAQVLGPELAARASAYFAVTAAGNFDGRTILSTPRDLGVVAAKLGLAPAVLTADLARARGLLMAARARRAPPHLDDKLVTAWNGLTISALARAGFALDRPDYLAAARRAAELVLTRGRTADGRLARSYRAGAAGPRGVLDDHACLEQGLLDLWDATSEPRWLDEAVALQRRLDDDFASPAGGYFATARDHEALLTRDRPSYDGAEPSGNAVALANLLRLADLTDQAAWRERAKRGLGSFAEVLDHDGTAAPRMLGALDYDQDRVLEIVLVAPHDLGELAPLVAEVRRTYLPNRALVMTTEAALPALARRVPFVQDKRALHGAATAFVCDRGVCQRPTGAPQVLAAQLREVLPLLAGRSVAPLRP